MLENFKSVKLSKLERNRRQNIAEISL